MSSNPKLVLLLPEDSGLSGTGQDRTWQDMSQHHALWRRSCHRKKQLRSETPLIHEQQDRDEPTDEETYPTPGCNRGVPRIYWQINTEVIGFFGILENKRGACKPPNTHLMSGHRTLLLLLCCSLLRGREHIIDNVQLMDTTIRWVSLSRLLFQITNLCVSGQNRQTFHE